MKKHLFLFLTLLHTGSSICNAGITYAKTNNTSVAGPAMTTRSTDGMADAADAHSFSFEGSELNPQWKAETGLLSLSRDRSQKGSQSLRWTLPAQKRHVLRIELTRPYSTKEQPNCYFCLYNPTALRTALLTINCYNAQGKMLRQARQSMNFIGWREFDRTYARQFSQNKGDGDIKTIEFVLDNPTGEATSLFFDAVDLTAPQNQVSYYSDWNIPDAACFEKAPLLTDMAYMLDETWPYAIPTDKETADWKKVLERYRTEIHAGDIAAARKYVTELHLTRNADGSIHAAADPLRGKPVLSNSEFQTICNRIATLGVAARTSEEDRVLHLNYLDYVLDQGLLYRINQISSSDYTTVRKMGQAVAEAQRVCATPRQAQEMGRIGFWVMSYGQIYRPDYLTHQNSDIIYNYVQYYTTYAAQMQDSVAAVRELKALKRYLDRATETTPGTCDLLKPDGTGFHHNTHYPNYMYCYRGWIDAWYRMAGTVFQPEEDSYLRFRKAAQAMCLMATRGTRNFLANSMAGRNPFNGNALQVTLEDMKKLSAVGGQLMQKESDPELDRFNTYMFAPQDTTTGYDGFYAFNWSPAGIYRHGNWVATMRSATQKFWGAEIYSKRNRFGRYQSHGSLEILYNGNQTPSGYPANKNMGGWDWNVVPGATTVHYTDWYEMMPKRNLTQRFDQFAKTKNFSGALAMGDCGLFATDFDQIDTWGSSCFTPTGLSFKKSVLAVDGLLIALGSQITATGKAAHTGITATNLFQSYKPEKDLNINGTLIKQSSNTGKLEPGNWLVTAEGTGFYLPEGNDPVNYYYGVQRAPLDDGSDIDNPASAVAAKAYINHGLQPRDKSYEYVVLPEADNSRMQHLAAQIEDPSKPLYRVNSKTRLLHSITYLPQKLTAYACFGAQSNMKGGHVYGVGSEMLLLEKEVSKQQLDFTVCNPHLRPGSTGGNAWQSAATRTSVTLNGAYQAAGSLPEGMTLSLTHDGQRTKVNMTLKEGLPLSFSLKPLETGIVTEEADKPYEVSVSPGAVSIKGTAACRVTVYTPDGRCVLQTGTETEHHMTLAAGTYLLQMEQQQGSYTQKVCIP